MQHIKKSEILFIVNLKAGSRKISSLVKAISNTGLNYIISSNLKELDKIMLEEINNYKVFVAVGGDGTVSSLANYLINNNQKAIAVLPTGSGNGFAYEIGFSRNLKRILNDIYLGNMLKTDVLRINNKPFINIAGIGLDANIAHRFHKFKSRGFLFYILSSVISYFKYKPFFATIINGNEVIKDSFMMICIANTRQFGNKAYISPLSKPFDGVYEIVAVKPIPLILSFAFVHNLFSGNIKPSKYVKFITCNNTSKIITDYNRFHTDGDPSISNSNYEIKIMKNCLNVIKPQKTHTAPVS